MKTFMLKELFGNLLSTRSAGESFRNKIRKLIFEGEDVFIDFSGIDVLSHSFADEIAKLIAEVKLSDRPRGKLTVRVTDPIQKRLLGTRIKFREKQIKEEKLQTFV